MSQQTGRHRASSSDARADPGPVYWSEVGDGWTENEVRQRTKSRFGLALAIGLVGLVVVALISSAVSGWWEGSTPPAPDGRADDNSVDLYEPVDGLPNPDGSETSTAMAIPSAVDTPKPTAPSRTTKTPTPALPPPATVTLVNPANQSGTVGTSTSLQLSATDTRTGAVFAFHASGLPGGLWLNSSNGRISGTPSTAGTYPVQISAHDNFGSSDSVSFVWTIAPSAQVCAAGQMLGNPGFETGSAAPWTSTLGVVDNSSPYPARSGSWKARLGGQGQTSTARITQRVTISGNCASCTLSFWLRVDTSETGPFGHDKLWVRVLNAAGSSVLATLATFDNTDAGDYVIRTFNVSSYAGQTIRIEFVATQDFSWPTSFLVDDAALDVS